MKKEALKELNRLSRMSPMASDSSYRWFRNYVEWLAALPWARSSGTKVDQWARLTRSSNDDHYVA